jgi:hypothetical protein
MIVSSTYKLGTEQIDGRHYVSEVHTDQDGVEYPLEYLADDNADFEAIMAAHSASISQSLADEEFNQTIAL